MGGLPCAKEIIDRAAEVAGFIECLNASVSMYAGTTEPTQQEVDRFSSQAEKLLEVGRAILKRLESGG